MKKIINIVALIAFTFSYTAQAAINANCLNDKGKYVPCTVENKDGVLNVNYESSKYKNLNRSIPGEKITKLTGGEYSRRRVAESVALGVLVAPIALFGLFSKKKLDMFGVEYKTEKDTPDAVLLSVKKKYGMSLKTTLQAVSGKEVEYGETQKK